MEFKNSLYSQKAQASFFLSHSLNFNLSEPMFYHFCKTILNGGKHVTIAQTPIHKLGFLQKPHLLSLSLKCNYISSTTNQPPFSVSYHINTLGFSQETALSASKYVHFEIPEKADSVVNFFKNHGFSSLKPRSQTSLEDSHQYFYLILIKSFCPKLISFPLKAFQALTLQNFFLGPLFFYKRA